MLGNKPGAAGYRSNCANHCAMRHVKSPSEKSPYYEQTLKLKKNYQTYLNLT